METAEVPLHNILSERDFSQVDRIVTNKPNISSIAISSVVMFCKNQTGKWLDQIKPQEKDIFMSRARRHVKSCRKKSQENKKQIAEARVKSMAEKQQRKVELEKKKSGLAEELSVKIASSGGLWQNDNIVEKFAAVDPTKKKDALILQLKYRKAVLGNKSLLLNLSASGKQFTDEILFNNLKLFLSDAATSTATLDSCVPEDATKTTLKLKEDRLILLKQAVQRKRDKPSSNTPQSKLKKARKNPVGHTILHRWQLGDGTEQWFEGKVIRAFNSVSLPTCEFEVQYEGSDELWRVPLYEDMDSASRDVVMLD
jgi:hypothetical protein